MTLAQALSHAESHAPELLAARSRLAAANVARDIPRTLWLPNLGITAQALEGTANNSSASYLSNVGVDLPRIGGTRSGTDTWRPEPSTLVAGGLRQEIFDFGRIAALSAVADAQAREASAKAQGARLDIYLAVRESYFAVRTSKAVLVASEGAYTRAKAHWQLASAGVHNGLRPPIEVTRAEADLMRFDVGRTRAQGGVLAAQSIFAAAAGVSDALLDTADEAIAAIPLPNLGQAVSEVEANSPLIQQARAREAVQQGRTRVLTTTLLPNLGLSATVSGRAGGSPPSGGAVPVGDGWLPNVPNWDGAVVFTWPLLDFGILAQRRASLEQERTQSAETESVRFRLRAVVQQAWEAVQVAQKALPALQRAAQAAAANEAQADARFRGGLGTSVELADAEALRADAEIQLALGQFEIVRVQAHLSNLTAEEQ